MKLVCLFFIAYSICYLTLCSNQCFSMADTTRGRYQYFSLKNTFCMHISKGRADGNSLKFRGSLPIHSSSSIANLSGLSRAGTRVMNFITAVSATLLNVA